MAVASRLAFFTMANTRSALKRIRQTESRTARNKSVKSRLKSARKAAAAALSQGKGDEAQKRARAAVSLADRAGRSGAIHRNTARRIQSRLARKLAAKQGA
jgi:small subunit ribosomal protein S20